MTQTSTLPLGTQQQRRGEAVSRLALKLEPIIAKKAKAAQVEGGKKKAPQKSGEAKEERKTRTARARAVGTNRRYLDAAEIVLRAERRLGDMLAETIERGRPEKGNTMLPLSELGISKMQSHRWQLAAKARDYYDRQAKERMNAGKKIDPSANLRQGSKGRAHDAAGKAIY
jgi:hypothetical protein